MRNQSAGGILDDMKVKTSVSLSQELLDAIDVQVGQGTRRSAFIEDAAWSYLRARERERRDVNDLAIINANAERLNAEARDALDFQAPL
jgi:metal-responsive CopG/Arc/MetJ family transcriptional regulator